MADYMKKIEKPENSMPSVKQMNMQYKKLKICSILLGIATIVGIIVSIVK